MIDLTVETGYWVKGFSTPHKTKEEAVRAALDDMREDTERMLSTLKSNKESFERKCEKLNSLMFEAQSIMDLKKVWSFDKMPDRQLLHTKTSNVEVPMPLYLNVNDKEHETLLRSCVIIYCRGMIAKLKELIAEEESGIAMFGKKLAEIDEAIRSQ